MRTAKISDATIAARAAELRAAGVWKGKPIHCSRGRPPAGSISLLHALRQRTGYSTTILSRALHRRDRSGGPRKPAPSLEGLNATQAIALIQQIYAAVAAKVLPGDLLVTESVPTPDRMSRLIDIVMAMHMPGAKPGTPEPTVFPPSVGKRAHTPQDLVVLVRNALIDAVDAALTTPGAVPAAWRRALESVSTQTQKLDPRRMA